MMAIMTELGLDLTKAEQMELKKVGEKEPLLDNCWVGKTAHWKEQMSVGTPDYCSVGR